MLLNLVAQAPEDPVFSGPQPGEKLSPFSARVFSAEGLRPGDSIDVFESLGHRPSVLMFVHQITRPGLQLLRLVDGYASAKESGGLEARVIWLTKDADEAEAYLNRARGSLNIKSPLVISTDGIEGPGNYGLNRNVTLTIIVARDDRVVANFAIVQPNETDAPRVLEPVARMLGREAPTLAQLQEAYGPRGGARPGSGRPSMEKEALPGRASNDPKLQGLMRRMIQMSNDDETVERVAGEMTAWAGDDAARKRELAEFCKRIVHVGYGTPAARRALRRLAGD
jgi:hypothetical protein